MHDHYSLIEMCLVIIVYYIVLCMLTILAYIAPVMQGQVICSCEPSTCLHLLYLLVSILKFSLEVYLYHILSGLF